jgi:hypothetical protein
MLCARRATLATCSALVGFSPTAVWPARGMVLADAGADMAAGGDGGRRQIPDRRTGAGHEPFDRNVRHNHLEAIFFACLVKSRLRRVVQSVY